MQSSRKKGIHFNIESKNYIIFGHNIAIEDYYHTLMMNNESYENLEGKKRRKRL